MDAKAYLIVDGRSVRQVVSGQVGLWHAKVGDSESIYVKVKVLQVRQVYDRVDYLITPISGQGSVWVASYRVTDLEKS